MSTIPLTFADVSAAIKTLNDDNSASNAAILKQLLQVKQLLVDYAGVLAGGGTISQADISAAIQRLETIDESVKANTTAITDSSTAIVAADPSADPQPGPEPVS